MSVRDVVQAAAGALSGEATYVEDVFSTYLYTGNATARDITNGTDLAGEGGMVWIKSRSNATNGDIFDTERGVGRILWTASTAAESYTADTQKTLTAFNADGFSLGTDSGNWGTNFNNYTYASWTWRKAPKFFDVVTYTGTGSAQNIPHNLGSVPGCVIVKATTSGKDWYVYHRGTDATSPEDYYTFLNKTQARTLNTNIWDTAPTDTHLVLGSHAGVNSATDTYVAYIFAHDAGGFGDDGEQNVISCGSFVSGSPGFVTLGYEPQWLLIKRSDSATYGNWYLIDAMRGLTGSGSGNSTFSYANTANTDFVSGINVHATATGFTESLFTGGTYIYIAIRRGLMKTPESGTDVFAASYADATPPRFNSTFPVDMGFYSYLLGSNPLMFTRLLQGNRLTMASTNAESSDTYAKFDYMDGYNSQAAANSNVLSWMFRRAPGFFDVVAYTGDGTTPRTINHNLGVPPELIITKQRDGIRSWPARITALGDSAFAYLNLTNASSTTTASFPVATYTGSTYVIGSNFLVNGSGGTYVAYLFATLDGVSKVGSYTGTAADLNVDCGFSAGARFILIKRTDSSGDWYVWDSERGIVAGNDPYLLINSTAAEVTSTDYIDPLSSGFTVTSSAPAALNASGGTYLFLAIA